MPFARYVALHGITNIKRYHIAKVCGAGKPAGGWWGLRWVEWAGCAPQVRGACAEGAARAARLHRRYTAATSRR